MKDSLLDLLTTWTALAEAVTWLFIAAALYLTGFAGWAGCQLVRTVARHMADRTRQETP